MFFHVPVFSFLHQHSFPSDFPSEQVIAHSEYSNFLERRLGINYLICLEL